MMTDLVPQLPDLGGDAEAGAGGELTIKTMNSNMGAIRVQVRRDLGHVRMQIAQLAQFFGDSFEYSLPFKKRMKGEDGRWIEKKEFVRGPSIRCTTAVARAYGNCSIDCTTASETGGAYVFDAAFLDVESGFRLTRPFRQRKDQNIGSMGGDSGRVEDVLFQIGASKATRNVIRNALPDMCEFAVEQARSSLAERIKRNRGDVEAKILARLEEFKIPLQRVEVFYGQKIGEMNERVLAQIVGLLRGVQDGMITAAEVCPKGDQAPAAGQPVPERMEGDEPTDDAGEPATHPDLAGEATKTPPPGKLQILDAKGAVYGTAAAPEAWLEFYEGLRSDAADTDERRDLARANLATLESLGGRGNGFAKALAAAKALVRA